MISVTVNNRKAVATPLSDVTVGSVGIPVSFHFSEDWDGLSKIAVFKAGSLTAPDMAILNNTCVVPHEVLVNEYDVLWVGIYGSNAQGTIVIPTIWAEVGGIQPGTELETVDPSEPTPSWVAQVQAAAEEALTIANGVKDDADSGAFDGADGTDGVSPAVTVTEITGGHQITITDASGNHSFTVMDGADGQDGQDGQDGSDGTNGQDGADGADGTDGVSPTVEVTTIEGGHRVTITDAEGSQYFDVMNGADGADGAAGDTGPQGETGATGKGIRAFYPNGTTTVEGVTYDSYLMEFTDDTTFTLNIPRGAKGDTGATGATGNDGITPTVGVTEITGGHNVAFNYGTGDQRNTNFNVMDGEVSQADLDAATAQIQQNAGDIVDLKSDSDANNTHGDVRFNIWDELWEKGIIDDTTGQNVGTNGWRSTNYIPVMPSTEYYLKGSVARVLYYAADLSYLSNVSSVANTTFTTPATARYIRIRSVTSGNPSYANNVCINLSQPDTTISPHNGDYVSGNTINYVGIKVAKLQKEMLETKVTADAVDDANSREYIAGTYLKQDGTEGPGLSQGTTGYIRFTPKDRAMLRGIVTGNTVYAYAFYDADKNYISGSSGGNNYSGDIDIPSTTVMIPNNSAYVRFSAKTNGENPIAIVLNAQAIETGVNGNAEEIHGLNTVIKNTAYVATKNSTQLTRYLQTGYINNDTGAFVANANYQCYYFDVHGDTDVWFNDASDNTWLQIAVYNGAMFNTNDLVSIGAKSRDTLPYIDSKIRVSEGNRIVVCVYIGEDFGLHYSEYALNDSVTQSLTKSAIRIRPVSSTQFIVDVLDETTDSYLSHSFIRTVYTDTLEYGSGQEKSIITSDIWYSNNILNSEGTAIAQGNTNFIQNLDITGHKGHIGAGHGGVVAVWSMFFADGERFDPATLDHEIECSKFRFQTKANHYLRDEINSPSSGHSYPSLDENGDPIIATVQYYDGEWSVNNRIVARNRLDIVLNQSFRFKQLHAGMCCGFYPYFDNVIVNNGEYLWNEFTESGGTFTATNKGGTSTILPCPATSKTGTSDEVTLFGDDYRLSTRIMCLNPARYGKPNTMVQTPPYSDNRIKGYLMPCICTDSLIPSGQSAETFSAGDSFDVMVYRSIDIRT